MYIVTDKNSKFHIQNRNLIVRNSNLRFLAKIAKPLQELASGLDIRYFCVDSESIPELTQIGTSYCFSFDLYGCKIQDIIIFIDSLKTIQTYFDCDFTTALNFVFCHELGHLLNYSRGDRSESSANLTAAKLMLKYQLCDRTILLKILNRVIKDWNIERC